MSYAAEFLFARGPGKQFCRNVRRFSTSAEARTDANILKNDTAISHTRIVRTPDAVNCRYVAGRLVRVDSKCRLG